MVAFTFERLIVVRYPLKRPKMCTVRRAKIIIVCLAILALVVQALSLFATGVIDISSFTPTPQQQQQSRNVTLGVMRSNSTQPPAAAGQSKTNYRQLKRFIAMLETAATVVVPSVLIVIMTQWTHHSKFPIQSATSESQSVWTTFQNGRQQTPIAIAITNQWIKQQ